MSKKKQITVDEYRKKHKRCRTCKYADHHNRGWSCTAKGTEHYGYPGDTVIKGCFCKLYIPKEF